MEVRSWPWPHTPFLGHFSLGLPLVDSSEWICVAEPVLFGKHLQSVVDTKCLNLADGNLIWIWNSCFRCRLGQSSALTLIDLWKLSVHVDRNKRRFWSKIPPDPEDIEAQIAKSSKHVQTVLRSLWDQVMLRHGVLSGKCFCFNCNYPAGIDTFLSQQT